MNHSEMINIWKAYDKKLDDTLLLNKKISEEVTKLKTKTILSSMTPIKVFTIIVGLVWVIAGSTIVGSIFLHAYTSASHFFLYSATLQIALTAIALIIYLYQLILIQQVDITEPLVKTQKRLAALKSSTLWVARVLFLQLPLWTTFQISESMIRDGNMAYILINGIVTAVFTLIAVWLFVNIRFENRDKKWFKLIFSGKEWTPIMKAIELHHQIEKFEKEDKSW